MDENEKVLTKKESGPEKDSHVFTIILSIVAIPLSMSMWIMNMVYSKVISGSEGFDEPVVISPVRWLVSCLLPIAMAIYGYRRKSLDLSGVAVGLVVGFILVLSNYCFIADLIVFFLTSSRATRYKSNVKKKIEVDFKEGGQRNWIQVLCNGGMATQLGLLYLLDIGSGERPIDFVKEYRASWLSIGVIGVLACCNGDTWASELGTALSKTDPILVTTLKKVPKGTNGGVSLVGTLCSTAGGLIIGISHYLTTIFFSDKMSLAFAPPQWPIIVYGALAGFLGSLVDSFLGATLQYSALDKDGKIVSHSSVSTKYICGMNILDNHSVNLLSTIIMGLLLPTISKNCWPAI